MYIHGFLLYRFVGLLNVYQIFDISFRSFDWRILQIVDGKTDLQSKIYDFINDLFMNCLVSYYAFFFFFFSARLKLWLDQTYYLTVVFLHCSAYS